MSDERNDAFEPEVWAECSVCKTAYVFRRCLSMSKGWVWCWQADCKHKKSENAEPQLAGRLV